MRRLPASTSLLAPQRHRRLAVWSIAASQAAGFVAVTPMRWPGGSGQPAAPRTPPGTHAALGGGLLPPPGTLLPTGPAGAGPSTPTARLPGGGGPAAGTYKK